MNLRVLALLMLTIGVVSAEGQERRTMTVGELFDLVEKGSRTLQRERMGVDYATQGIETARSQRLPDVNVSLSASYNGNVVVMDRDFGHAQGFSSPHFGNSLAIEAQQVVYAGGAIDAGVRLSELERDMALNAQRTTLDGQRFLALGQYLELYKLGNRRQVYEQNIALTQRLIADIRAKQEQGMALRNDVTRYELQMETLRLGLRRVEDQQAILNHQLCNTLGLEAATLIEPDPAIAQDGVSVSQSEGQGAAAVLQIENQEAAWLSQALANSPQVEQSQIGTLMAQQQLKLAKSEMLPKIALVAGDNLSGPFTYDIPPIDKNINYWYVGVGLKYPLSSLYKARKRVRQAETGVERSRQQQTVVAEQIDNQVQQAWTMYQQSFADLDTQRKSVELARQNYQVVSDRYLNQLALITDMLDASNIRLNAELLEVDARINIVYAYYKLKYVAGTL